MEWWFLPAQHRPHPSDERPAGACGWEDETHGPYLNSHLLVTFDRCMVLLSLMVLAVPGMYIEKPLYTKVFLLCALFRQNDIIHEKVSSHLINVAPLDYLLTKSSPRCRVGVWSSLV
ncbi:hypothetical protein Moror_2986 [Moniliophthora roreri MCA 2997]|uniref:Uncharacterized protein n=1 Tax=Moniliophthora roreri (strain MCA 2997) TaxID=1381753 RepID=V2YAL3_MONRO|nr:hypothetical protein Moror_2986 [Moniliophthora roreri MCA 2997]